MPAKNVEPLHISVPKGKREQITDYAKKRGYPVYADYIRELIERDMRKHKEAIDLDVDRGGDRREKAS